MARKRYNKGNRLDMRQGGRVALARGRRPIEQEEVSIPPVKPVKKKPVKSRNPRDFQQQTGGRKGVGAPRTPEELQRMRQLAPFIEEFFLLDYKGKTGQMPEGPRETPIDQVPENEQMDIDE